MLNSSAEAGPAASLDRYDPLPARFLQLTVEQGLSQAAVQTIIQDHRGFIWLGTQSGLNRFDGRQVVSYFHDPNDPDSLSHNWIWALHEDAAGILWVGTARGGLNRFDPRTGRSQAYKHDPTDPRSLPHDSVRAIAPAGNGRLWIGTEGGGLARFDPVSGHFERIPLQDTEGNPISQAAVLDLEQGGDGRLWVATDGRGLFQQLPGSDRFEQVPLPIAAERLRTLAHDGENTLWIGTYYDGVLALNEVSGATRHYQEGDDRERALSSNLIRTLQVDATGILWIGTYEDGLNRLDPLTGRVSHYRTDPMDANSLRDDHVIALFQDRGDVLWVGTYVGASYWNPNLASFRSVTPGGPGPGQLSDNYVTSLESQGDLVWVGTHGGLNVFHRPTGTVQVYRHLTEDPASLSQDLVWALAADPEGAVWVGTQSKGLNRLDPRTGRFTQYQHDPDDPTSLSGNGITSLVTAPDRGLWAGTFGAGLNYLPPDGSAFVRIRAGTGADALNSNIVFTLERDAAGTLWVGSDRGLNAVTADGRVIASLQHDPDNPDSISEDVIWALHEDASGNLWIGTESAGLNLWRAADRAAGRVRFERYGQEQGLSSPNIYAIESDFRGQIWISTNNGLYQFDPAERSFRRYTTVHGLPHNEFNFAASTRAGNGELYFGGINGFTLFNPRQVAPNPHPPQLSITRVWRMNKASNLWPLVDDSGVLQLDHRDRLITFEYAALDFSAPDLNRFAHKLEGFDSEWVQNEQFERATYTNLAPGQYRLLVRAANADGVWSPVPLVLPINIQPPPWATPWAYAGYLLLFLAIAAALVRNALQRMEYAREIRASNASLREEIRYRQVQQRALHREKQASQRYLDVVEVMILVLDSAGNITLINQKGLRIVGYDEGDLIGRNFYDVLLPESARNRVRDQFEHLTGYGYSESPILTQRGDERLIAWHSTPIPPLEEDPGGLIISGADVTEMRDLEHRMHEAQKVEALGNMARGIAHDFNNILSSILGYTELSLDEVPDNSAVARNLKNLETSVQRARHMVEGILSFSSQQPQNLVPTALQAVIQETVSLLRPSLPATVQLSLDLDPYCPAVMANPTLLSRVVMNLCTNAYQAIGDGGGELQLILRNQPASRQVELVIQDTGAGMDEETLSRAFDPFFTTKSRSEGSGLGLSVVRSIIVQLGGTIDASSERGHGSVFRIRLPATHLPAITESSRSEEPPTRLNGTETILFVDDERSVVSIATKMLERLGYQLLCAYDGSEALSLFNTCGVDIDLVITDQTMPRLQGTQLAELLKERRADLPIIMISGAGAEPADNDAISLFINKPYSQRELATAIRQVLDNPPPKRSGQHHGQGTAD